MALRGALVWLCSLAVWSCAAQHETLPVNCTSQSQLFERLSDDLKLMEECGAQPPSEWSGQQAAALLLPVRQLSDALFKHQLKECRGAEPMRCPEAEVPDNGGLVCGTIANNTYCKPLCNHGFDFGFIRHSRLYDECSERTGYKWNTQYVGGNRLAVCNRVAFQISGGETAHFPKDQDCLTTKGSSRLQDGITDVFTAELRAGGVKGDLQFVCLVCGRE